MRHLLDNSELYIIGMIITFAVFLSGGINFSRVNPTDQSGAATMVSPAPNAHTTGLQLQNLIPIKGPGLHGAFIVNSPSDVELAAKYGISYIISYSTDVFNDPMKSALTAHNMKVYLDMHKTITYQAGTCAFDSATAQSLITQYDTNPLLGGYWIKDDDVNDKGTLCDMKPALQSLHDGIRAIDQDASHKIIAGFGEPSGLNENYLYGTADILAFYPYPHYDGGTQNVATNLIPQMAKIVQQDKLPQGKTPPPFIGVYQSFEGTRYDTSNCTTPTSESIAQLSPNDIQTILQAYKAAHAIGVAAFSIGAACDVHQTAGNDTHMEALVNTAWRWLQQNGGM